MLAVSQILLLLVSCYSITADVSADDGGVPTLTGNLFDIGLPFEQSRFTTSINAPQGFVHHNGSRERNTGYCYEPGYSCDGAFCCDNGSCAGNDQTCCGNGICQAGYGCCIDHCILLSDACCTDGTYCPAGQGCFSYDDNPQIFCSPTAGGVNPPISTITNEVTGSPPNEPTLTTVPAASPTNEPTFTTTPTTSTVTSEFTVSSLNEPTPTTTALVVWSSVYYYTYEYEWTTFYYIDEIETSTTYAFTTVWSVVATDAIAAASAFGAIKATFAPTAPSTSLPSASIPSPSPTAQPAPLGLTAPAFTLSASQSTMSSISSFAGSGSGAPPSAEIRRETLGVMCIIGALMMMIIM